MEDLARQLRVLVQIDHVRLRQVNNFLLLRLLLLLGFAKLLLPTLLHLRQRRLHLVDLFLLFLFQLCNAPLELLRGFTFPRLRLHWSLSFEHLLELFVLFSQLSDQLGLRVFIDLRLVLDLLRTIGVSQGGQRLLVVRGCWGHSADHDRLTVPAQRVLQQPCQLGVSVGNDRSWLPLARRFVGQCCNHVSQRRKRLVDSTSLFQAIACGAGLAGLLRARQIHQIDHGELHAFLVTHD
mmetsp:Transcript_74167/g.197779  ORF Transcript_74167/g.197779 Transcript_74167/m.197779 type:complete len:237 (+) Transcript_74167:1678-2388(+)